MQNVLSTLQASNLSDVYADWAATILNYRRENFQILSEGTRKNLFDSAMTLLDNADEWTAETAADIPDEVRNALDKTVEVTGEIKKTFRTLTNIEKGIAVVSCVVTLGQTIITKNPLDINNALNNLLDKWNS